jgi:hypothetical protein
MQKRTVTNKVILTATKAKEVIVLCSECVSAGLTIAFCAEGGYKLFSGGGVNVISPWRMFAMNQAFPDDESKVWTESKCFWATHNRAMGKPHSDLYKSHPLEGLQPLPEVVEIFEPSLPPEEKLAEPWVLTNPEAEALVTDLPEVNPLPELPASK